MVKPIIEIILIGTRLVGKAFYKAFREELQASRETSRRAGGGRRGARQAENNLKYGISVEEAQKILNVTDLKDIDRINKNYEHLFDVNQKSKGGSFYLQSKVFRAKERLDQEILNMKTKDKRQEKIN